MVVLDETLAAYEADHRLHHQVLRDAFLMRNPAAQLPVFVNYGVVHDEIHATLHDEHNDLGLTPTLPTAIGGSEHVEHHEILAAAHNVREVTPDIPQTALRGWWKADAITGVASGAALTSWPSSVDGGVPLTATTGPLYVSEGAVLSNTRPAVQFTGAVNMVSTTDNNTASTKFIVLRPGSFGGGSSFYAGSGGNGYELGLGPGGKFDVFVGNTIVARTGTAEGTPIPINTWHVLAVRGNGSNSTTTYIDGVQDGPTSTAGHSPASTGTIVGSSNGGGYFNGWISEVIDYSVALSDLEMGEVTDYLLTKYAIGEVGAPDLTGVFRNFDWDTSENQAFTHSASDYQVGAAHQHAWLTTPTRLGTGHSERFECHGQATDIAGGNSYRAMMDVVDTNEGGDTVGAVIGYPEVYYALSTFWPTVAGTPSQATITPGYSQVGIPFESIMEIHERGNVNGGTVGINNLNQVTNHHIGLRNGQLQYRGCNGTWTWNGSGWTQPAWNTGTPGTTGKNDQIPVPIVKPGVTDAAMPSDTWVDIIIHILFRKDLTGLVEVWARQAGQEFTTLPGVTINGPTHKVAVGSDGVTRSSADYEAANLVTGCYFHCGLYPAGTVWADGTNGAHVQIIDELRRYGTLAEAKANWE
jgi:hypothetical protein